MYHFCLESSLAFYFYQAFLLTFEYVVAVEEVESLLWNPQKINMKFL